MSRIETAEERQQRNLRVMDDELCKMEHGNITHEVWVQNTIGLPGMEIQIDPVVRIANSEDGFYVQTFKCPEDVDRLIQALESAKLQAWPEHKL